MSKVQAWAVESLLVQDISERQKESVERVKAALVSANPKAGPLLFPEFFPAEEVEDLPDEGPMEVVTTLDPDEALEVLRSLGSLHLTADDLEFPDGLAPD